MNELKPEDVMRAFAACNGLAPTEEVDCELCPFCDYDAHKKCTEELAKAVLALLREKDAEIEKLIKDLYAYQKSTIYWHKRWMEAASQLDEYADMLMEDMDED